MTVVRETYERCKKTRHALQTHMVRYEERDLYMSQENQRQLAERMDRPLGSEIEVPQVFIDGIHIGVSFVKFHYTLTELYLRKTK